MDIERIQKALGTFIKKHSNGFYVLANKETQALEIGALVLATEHYSRRGYATTAENLQDGFFKLKLKNGHPRSFSWYQVAHDGRTLEIHGNLSVKGAHSDGAQYVVDVGVVDAGHTPSLKIKAKAWTGHPNDKLRTFVEAKKLEIYPMLLAQFVGIVHEIQPAFLRRRWQPAHDDDFYPALVSIGTLRATSKRIREGFDTRGFKLNVLPAFDNEVLRMSKHVSRQSPFLPLPPPDEFELAVRRQPSPR